MIESANAEEAQSNPWFVIWTESRAEKKVEARIAALGLPTWLPTVKERRRWSDRWREVVSPLFPGYLFARATASIWHAVLNTQGVLTVVKEGGSPAMLSDAFVTRLREAVQAEGAAPRGGRPSARVHPG